MILRVGANRDKYGVGANQEGVEKGRCKTRKEASRASPLFHTVKSVPVSDVMGAYHAMHLPFAQTSNIHSFSPRVSRSISFKVVVSVVTFHTKYQISQIWYFSKLSGIQFFGLVIFSNLVLSWVFFKKNLVLKFLSLV